MKTQSDSVFINTGNYGASDGGAAGSNSVLRTGGIGGGNGATNGAAATAGQDGFGGGGGGGTGVESGSGIVIISYAGAQRGTGGTVTSVGGNTIHTFTSSDTYTA